MKRPFILLAICCFGFALKALSQDWQQVPPGQFTQVGVDVINGTLWGDTGIVITVPGYILKTTNFFDSYTVDSDYEGSYFVDMVFVNRDTGYIPSPGIQSGMLQTVDGGNSWAPASVAYNTQSLGVGNELTFANNDTAYTSDNISNIMTETFDAGYTWFSYVLALDTFDCAVIYRIQAEHDSAVYVLCSSASPPSLIGRLLLNKSGDCGLTWQNVSSFDEPGSGDFYILDDTTFLVLTGNYIYKSTNGGRSYDTVLITGFPFSELPLGHCFTFPSHDTGFAGFLPFVYRTYDAGSTWTRTSFQFDTNELPRVAFIYAANANQVIVGGTGGGLYKTSNGGGVFTGIGETPAQNSLQLYPNPALNQLNCILTKYTPNTIFQITSTDGRIVQAPKPVRQNHFQIDVSQLAAGIYFLTLQNENERVVKKFVKE
jgi:photosystem II stability/assembly factor-like uncharacterized protein